ncbi:hypothetical protein C8J57DRAFT_219536 [Mycena rebaudengoi]|nr:hypothetical protein C8J57DRAFT_219536 [Mycena rebaudengoi]
MRSPFFSFFSGKGGGLSGLFPYKSLGRSFTNFAMPGTQIFSGLRYYDTARSFSPAFFIFYTILARCVWFLLFLILVVLRLPYSIVFLLAQATFISGRARMVAAPGDDDHRHLDPARWMAPIQQYAHLRARRGSARGVGRQISRDAAQRHTFACHKPRMCGGTVSAGSNADVCVTARCGGAGCMGEEWRVRGPDV